MDKEKSPIKSRTIWAAVVTMFATFLQMIDIEILTPEYQRNIVEGILALIQLGGAIAAIYYRCIADKKLF